MEVHYTPKGPKGKTCNVCRNFKPTGGIKGSCYGHDVIATGSCDYFKSK